MIGSRRSRLRRLLEVELPVLLIVLFALAPYVWMVLTSVKPSSAIATFPVQYLPADPTLEHYRALLARTSFLRNLLDSLVVAVGAVVLGLGVSVPAAYAFSRFRFAGRSGLLVFFLTINMVPVVMLIIPLFVLMRQLGLIDTFVGVVMGHATFAIPFSVWMMTSYFNALPAELDEAALVDGATRWQTIRHVVLPLAMPGIVAAAAICFALGMNAYATPVLIGGPSMQMMGPLVYEQIAKVSNWPFGSTLACILMAVTVLLTVVSTRYLSRKYF